MKSPRSELATRTVFRSRVKIQCPAVRVIGIPNAAKRGQRAMNTARKEGAMWGFPDDLCLWAIRKVAMVEWKRVGEEPDQRQLDVHAMLRRMGFPVLVATDPDQALAWLRGLGAPFLCDDARSVGEVIEPIVADLLQRLEIGE